MANMGTQPNALVRYGAVSYTHLDVYKRQVYDITERYPELIDFLAANGFGKISNPLMRKTIGKQISLEMAFKSRHVDSDAMEKQLVEVIENNANGVSKEVSDTPSHISKEKCAIQIEGILPCPIRLPLMDVFETWRDTHHMDVNFDLQSASCLLYTSRCV